MKHAPTSKPSKFRRRPMLAAWLLLGGWIVLAATPKSASEHELKAVFLYNFTKFVTWPVPEDGPTDSPFVIGILGDDPFGATLDNAVHGESVQHRPIVVQRLRGDQGVAQCDILFIAQSEKDRLKAVLQKVGSRPVLTVADTPGAAEQGVMINLSVVQNSAKMEINVKMEINENAVKSAGLKVSAKLLNLAKIVKTQRDKTPARP
jgi:hypothetical protein